MTDDITQNPNTFDEINLNAPASESSEAPAPAAETGLQLNAIEARIVGALIEKELTTPEYYPLTLNALAAACNQKNNRAPLMALDGRDLQTGIYSLQDKRLVECFSGATSRTVKYRERFIAHLELDQEERALICELLLRGAQTPGELKNRATRMHPFTSLEQVAAALERLARHDPSPLVAELPRQLGQKETRFMHLLGDQPLDMSAPSPAPAPVATVADRSSRMDALEMRVSVLEEELSSMRAVIAAFKAQFE
jgi:Uncharacterized protein conserved in bacteria